MHKFTLLGFLLVILSNFYSQKTDTINLNSDKYISDRDAKYAVSQIVFYCGLEPNFDIVEDYNITNANAFIKKRKRYIKYNPDFLQRISDSLQTDWAAWSVLAHELGHHLLGHTLSKHSISYQNELEADKFSGFILYQMGATLEESLICIESEGNLHGTKTHPAIDKRVEAITMGWIQAEQVKNNTIKQFKQTDSPNLNEDFTHRIKFNNELTSYYLNLNKQLIWYDNYANAILICQLDKSTSRSFEWMFILEKSKYAIDAKGGIWLLSTHGNNLSVGTTESLKD